MKFTKNHEISHPTHGTFHRYKYLTIQWPIRFIRSDEGYNGELQFIVGIKMPIAWVASSHYVQSCGDWCHHERAVDIPSPWMQT